MRALWLTQYHCFLWDATRENSLFFPPLPSLQSHPQPPFSPYSLRPGNYHAWYHAKSRVKNNSEMHSFQDEKSPKSLRPLVWGKTKWPHLTTPVSLATNFVPRAFWRTAKGPGNEVVSQPSTLSRALISFLLAVFAHSGCLTVLLAFICLLNHSPIHSFIHLFIFFPFSFLRLLLGVSIVPVSVQSRAVSWRLL